MEIAEELSCTPPELRETALEAVGKLLPAKSKALYEKEFMLFNKWCSENKVHNITENVLLAYYEQMSQTKKSSTLWTSYSMLRSCLNINRNIDISKFTRLQAFLKRKSEGYQPKKSKVLEPTEIERFIQEADDSKYLAMKVILIMGYTGACRRDELMRMRVEDIELKEDTIHVTVPKTKTNVSRLFIITEVHWIYLIRKYLNLRPRDISINRFFLTFRNGRCLKSPIGINKIGQVPRIIAAYLKLPSPEQYTGHCFRRSSASNLANRGGDLVTIKQHGGWKSSAVAEGYIDASIKKKTDVAEMFRTRSPRPSTSTFPEVSDVIYGEKINATSEANRKNIEVQGDTNYQQNVFSQNLPGISIKAQDTCTVTINYYNNCTIEKK